MSEYQFYEFRALDRPLNQAEMDQLRALSSRAEITPTSFVNVYHYGDFRGDVKQVLAKYFDVFVYVANWGTHRLMLRVPRRLLDVEAARAYATDESCAVEVKGEYVVLNLISQEEEGGSWEEGADWMDSLAPVREELLAGDLRCLYLAWLVDLQVGGLEDDEEPEPPVPPGLRDLSAPLKSLAEYLRIEKDLLAVAAERSEGNPPSAPSAEELRGWVRTLSAAEKEELLVRSLEGNAPHLRAELLQRFLQERRQAVQGSAATPSRRTVGELRAAWEGYAEEQRRREAEAAARERERVAREKAAARKKHLDSLAGQETRLWEKAEALAETKRPKEYAEAVQLLKDLRDLAARQGQQAEVTLWLSQFRERHARKRSLIQQLDKAGL